MNQMDYIVPVLADEEKAQDWDDSVILGGETTQLKDGRPVKIQAWAESGLTFITYFLSIIGLESHTKEEVIHYLNMQGVNMQSNVDSHTSMIRFTDLNNQECWSITFTVGESED